MAFSYARREVTVANKKPQKNTRARRPTKLTDNLRKKILNKISDGYSVRKLCADRKYPTRDMFYKWIREDASFAEDYEKATQYRADFLADEILEIADDDLGDFDVRDLDDETIAKIDQIRLARAKVKIDARKWIAAKMSPKKYGNNVKVESDNKHDHAGSVTIEITDYSAAESE